MSEPSERHPIALKTVRYTLPGVDAVNVRVDVAYKAGDEALVLDVYLPPEADRGAPVPAVVIVLGYPDVGVPQVFGCQLKEMGLTVSWARLLAASGMAAVIYTTRHPATDVHAVLEHLRRNAAQMGVDGRRIGVFAASGNVAVALSALMQDPDLKCAALLYGFTLDLDGSTAVAEAARTFGFVNACAGRSIDHLPGDVPLLVVRAGKDQFAGLNETLDRFLMKALQGNLPVSFVNYATGAHGFDLDDDSAASAEIVRQVLAFLRFHTADKVIDNPNGSA
jgi:dienelactone hydrolase